MNREILFRGKTIHGKEWVEGSLARCQPVSTGEYNISIIPSYASAIYGLRVYPETAGQYTGMNDKNGRRIFEGDIVKFGHPFLDLDGSLVPPDLAEIVFRDSCWCMAPADNRYIIAISSFGEEDLEIVGNTHDNPELLEVKKNG